MFCRDFDQPSERQWRADLLQAITAIAFD